MSDESLSTVREAYGIPTGSVVEELDRRMERMEAALDLEARMRETMSLAFDRATADLKAAEEKLKARDAFLRQVMEAMESGEAADDTVWFNSHTTLYEAIEWLLDDPKARGEQALPLEV